MKGDGENMDIIGVIADICTIVGLFVAIFVASQVTKITKSNNNNTGEIHQGDGNQKVAKDKAAFADHNSKAVYNDYSDSTIYGEIDEIPDVDDNRYTIEVEEVQKYSKGVSEEMSNLVVPSSTNTVCISADFTDETSKPQESRWLGYAIKSLPMRDWRGFVENDFTLKFNYISTESIDTISIELTNKVSNKKILQRHLTVSNKNKEFVLPLGKYKKDIIDWKSVDEICFVFFPEECIAKKGTIYISDLSLIRQ
jgi:hypothetical protein